MTKYNGDTATVYNFQESQKIFNLYKTILNNPGKTINELSKLTKTAQPLTSLQIACLLRNKAIKIKRNWRQKQVYADEDYLKSVIGDKPFRDFEIALNFHQLKEMVDKNFKLKAKGTIKYDVQDLYNLVNELQTKIRSLEEKKRPKS